MVFLIGKRFFFFRPPGPVRSARVAELEQGSVQLDTGKLSESVAMPEQQREPGEQPVRGQGQLVGLQGRRASPVRHTATGHENETETVEKIGLDGLGRRVAAGIADLHLTAPDVHSR